MYNLVKGLYREPVLILPSRASVANPSRPESFDESVFACAFYSRRCLEAFLSLSLRSLPSLRLSAYLFLSLSAGYRTLRVKSSASAETTRASCMRESLFPECKISATLIPAPSFSDLPLIKFIIGRDLVLPKITFFHFFRLLKR